MSLADLRDIVSAWTPAEWLQNACAAAALALALFVLPWAAWVLALVCDLPVD